MIHIQSVELLRALILILFFVCAACGSDTREVPAESAETSPRRLDDIDDAARRLFFDTIIECENEGLRAAAAERQPSGPDGESRRARRQHMAEAECKDALKRAERLSAQQLVFLRTYGMQHGWFGGHADETPAALPGH